MPQAPISVVIPAFNAERYLAEAIDSVHAQTLAPAEVIVIDDGSTDGTGELVRQRGDARLVRQDNAGVAAALNHGVRVASGELVAFLSADDVWMPDKLRLQVAGASRPGELVFGHMQHFISPELPEDVARGLVCPAEPMPAFSAGTLLTRRETFATVGPLNESFAVGEFMDWYGRATDLGLRATMLADVVSRRRVHSSNHSTTTLRDKSYAPVLHALIARRRAEAARK
jgi:glycosyltransferase involved in cell wall biosynthesis